MMLGSRSEQGGMKLGIEQVYGGQDELGGGRLRYVNTRGSASFDCCPNKVACQRLRRVWISGRACLDTARHF